MRKVCDGMLLFLLLAVLVTGCCSRKHILAGAPVAGATAVSVALLPSANRSMEYLSCNMKMSASVGDEGTSAKGKLRVRQGKGIQLSATAMGLMEAACLEFLPHTVKFIYKIDKIYAEAPYSGIHFMSRTGTDYNILEAVILNSMFSPDGVPFKKALKGMDIADEGECITVTTSNECSTVYRFFIDKDNGNLIRSEGRYADGGSVVCSYSEFAEHDGVPFPRAIEISFYSNGMSASLVLRLGSPKSDEFKFSSRRVSGVYEKVSFDGILESIGNIE